MSGKVGRSGSGPESPKKRESNDEIDSEAFKDLMKIDKVKEVDIEEKKKKKSLTGKFDEEKQAQEQVSAPQKKSTGSRVSQEEKNWDTELGKAAGPSSPTTQKPSDQEAKNPEKKQEILAAKKASRAKAFKAEKGKFYKASDVEEQKAQELTKKEKEELNKIDTEFKEAKEHFETAISKKKEEAAKKEESGIPLSIRDLPKELARQTVELTSTLVSYLHPDIISFFEKMIGTIIVMQSSGDSQTEVTLNSPAFASSVFYDTKITLSTYSTAPLQYNIQLTCPSNQAVTLFNENLNDLKTAFSQGDFNFKIKRIEAYYETEKPKIRRKQEEEEGQKQR